MDALFRAIDNNEALFAWIVSISLVTFFGSLIAVPLFVVRMRSDYFIRTAVPKVPKTPWRAIGRFFKNILGFVFLLMGIAMLLLPGQGVLTILIGLSLVDFPGKRRLQLRIVRFRSVYRTVNWLRHKAHRDPLRLP